MLRLSELCLVHAGTTDLETSNKWPTEAWLMLLSELSSSRWLG